ncbi:hypothetical protein ACLK19_19170 [Escherichia coli]
MSLPALSSKIFRGHPSAWRTPLCRRAGTDLPTQRFARHTGHICDHQCQYNCTRLDYDSALNIRELKKVALEKGWDGYKRRWHKPVGSGLRHPVAVIGAGPAGLAQVTSLPERAIRLRCLNAKPMLAAW